MDLGKAFDKVPQKLLTSKLKLYNIHNIHINSVNWIEAFLGLE